MNNQDFIAALNNSISAISSTRDIVQRHHKRTNDAIATLQETSRALVNAQSRLDDTVNALESAVNNIEDPFAGFHPINIHLIERTLDVYTGDALVTMQSSTTGVGITDAIDKETVIKREVLGVLENSLILYTVYRPALQPQTVILHGHTLLDQECSYSRIANFVPDDALNGRLMTAAALRSSATQHSPSISHLARLVGAWRVSHGDALSVDWFVNEYHYVLDIIPAAMLTDEVCQEGYGSDADSNNDSPPPTDGETETGE